jgi:hypothetical protein
MDVAKGKPKSGPVENSGENSSRGVLAVVGVISSCTSTRFTDKLECTAFLRPDGQKVLVVLNRSSEEIPMIVRWQNRIAETKSEAHSIQTILF